jgi:SOUL heme-binding protein
LLRAAQERGGLFASLGFSGIADDRLATKNASKLAEAMTRNGLRPERDESGSVKSLLLQYNEPTVLPPFRRNEVLVPIADGFDLWDT